MKLKVCGMKYKENIITVAGLMPDYMGFIFHKNSQRNFIESIPKIPKSIIKTGVFVNESITFVNSKIKEHQLHAVQLHGEESAEFCAQIAKDIIVIKTFLISQSFNFEILMPYENVCDFYLFDTAGKYAGGNGISFNWEILDHYPASKPYFLSGGIGLENIHNVNQFLQTKAARYCVAIDVNSKFEISPGLKNEALLKSFKTQIIS